MNDIASTPKPKKHGRTFLLFLIVLVISLATFNYYLWQYLADIKKQIQQQTAPLQEKVSDSPQQSKNLPPQDSPTQLATETLKHLEEQVATLTQQQQQLQMSVQMLTQQPRYRADWLLAEVVYLLNLANQRLILVADVEGALTVLILAKERLQLLNNPSVLNVRKQLTADIDRLRKVTRPDINGFAIQLSNFIAQIENLPLLQRQHQLATSKAETKPKTVEKSLTEMIWHEIKQLVIIRYNTEATTGLLTAEQSHFIVQNLRLQLESAKLALLRQDSKNLRATIKMAQHGLDSYYDQQNEMVKKLQIFLNQLQQLELNPKLPDVSVTLQSLQQLIVQPTTVQDVIEETVEEVKP